MNDYDLFKTFEEKGMLVYPEKIDFGSLPWNDHPIFEGVALKHLITSKQTSGLFSYHLVKVAPNKKIGMHVHEKQLETHEVIAGSGVCNSNNETYDYIPGHIGVFPMNVEHEIVAGEEGMYIFAKFIPALL